MSEPVLTRTEQNSQDIEQESASLTANESLDLTKRVKKTRQQSVRQLVDALHSSQMAAEERGKSDRLGHVLSPPIKDDSDPDFLLSKNRRGSLKKNLTVRALASQVSESGPKRDAEAMSNTVEDMRDSEQESSELRQSPRKEKSSASNLVAIKGLSPSKN